MALLSIFLVEIGMFEINLTIINLIFSTKNFLLGMIDITKKRGQGLGTRKVGKRKGDFTSL